MSLLSVPHDPRFRPAVPSIFAASSAPEWRGFWKNALALYPFIGLPHLTDGVAVRDFGPFAYDLTVGNNFGVTDVVMTPFGVGALLDRNGGNIANMAATGVPTFDPTAEPFTLFGVVRRGSAESLRLNTQPTTSGAATLLGLTGGGAVEFSSESSSFATRWNTSGGSVALGEVAIIAAQCDLAEARVYLNGALVGTDATLNLADPETQTRIGLHNTGIGNDAAHDYIAFYILRGADPAIVEALSASPFGPFVMDYSQYWGAVPAVGAITMPADSGSFAVTGQDAGLEHDRLLNAEAGSFAITGADAALLYDRLLNAEGGAFVVTGGAAALEHGRLLNAEGGVFVVTGAAAALLYDRVLAADGGAYLFTGQDATLIVDSPNPVLDAEAGSFAIAGQDAGLEHGRLLSAEAGAFVVTGQDASLLLARTLAADSGAFVITGFDATLTRSITVLVLFPPNIVDAPVRTSMVDAPVRQFQVDAPERTFQSDD